MRFQCLEITCGKPFGWTAKKIVTDGDNTTFEYVVCPYCGGLDFEEYRNGRPQKTVVEKPVPPVQYPTSVGAFDPADLMNHQWLGKKIGPKEYAPAGDKYGWDYKTEFTPTTLGALEGGPLTIGQHKFELKDRIVSMQKIGGAK